MGMSDKIRVLLAYRNMSVSELARRLGITQQALSQKMMKDDFRESDLTKIAEQCDASFEGFFTLNDSKKSI